MLSVDVPSDTFEEAEQIVPEEGAEVVSGETDKNLQEAGKDWIPITAIPSQIKKTFSLSYLDGSKKELHVIGFTFLIYLREHNMHSP